jgi:hypothetical protein
MSIKCAIYVRVSSKSQDTDNQLQPLKEYAERCGYEVVGIYEDNESWIKRSWCELTIYEDFDFSKLQIYISRDDIFGSDSYVETFSLNYGEFDFEFRENYGANSSETYIVDSNGKQTEFEIIDDEDLDEE